MSCDLCHICLLRKYKATIQSYYILTMYIKHVDMIDISCLHPDIVSHELPGEI